VQAKQLAVTGRIFSVESVRSRQPGKGNILRLKVNFMPEIITLAKEVSWLCLHYVLNWWLCFVKCFWFEYFSHAELWNVKFC